MSKERKIFRPSPHNAGYEVVEHLNGQAVTVPRNLNRVIGGDTVVIRATDGTLWTAFESELEDIA